MKKPETEKRDIEKCREELAEAANAKKPFVVAWEYMDGSGGWHDFDTHEDAYQYAETFFGEPLRIWINEEIVNHGFIASDEREP